MRHFEPPNVIKVTHDRFRPFRVTGVVFFSLSNDRVPTSDAAQSKALSKVTVQ